MMLYEAKINKIKTNKISRHKGILFNNYLMNFLYHRYEYGKENHMIKYKHIFYSAIILTVTVGGFQYSAAADSDAQAYINAIPGVTGYVADETKKACDVVGHMEKYPVNQPLFHKRLGEWKNQCDRGNARLSKLQNGSEQEKVDNIKEMIKLGNKVVPKIVAEEQAKLHPNPNAHPKEGWDSPL